MINEIKTDDFLTIGKDSIPYSVFKFSGGELNINIDKSAEDFLFLNRVKNIPVLITKRINNSDDLMSILLAKNALENIGFKLFELFIPYVPYARQDRICNFGEAFSLKVFANIINSANFEKVFILDAHSDVTSALLNNSVNLSNKRYVDLAATDISYDHDSLIYLVSPDAGSNKKSNKLFDESTKFRDIIKCDKVRNLKDGRLTNFTVFAEDLKGATCLIVDDICDGGRTFTGIAEKLKEKNAGNLYLFVTHGIFSSGFDGLLKYFECIYTTDSIKKIDYKGIKQYKVQK